MEVKKIWRIQFMVGWVVLALLLMGGGFLLATGKVEGLALIVAGIVIELVCSILMFRNYRCPKCGAPLNRRAVKSIPGVITCPGCHAGIQEV